jgi:APA family basic amino acid/polyamine antiporter
LGDSFVFPTSKLLAIASIIVLTFINTKGLKGKLIQLILTSAKLIALLH